MLTQIQNRAVPSMYKNPTMQHCFHTFGQPVQMQEMWACSKATFRTSFGYEYLPFWIQICKNTNSVLHQSTGIALIILEQAAEIMRICIFPCAQPPVLESVGNKTCTRDTTSFLKRLGGTVHLNPSFRRKRKFFAPGNPDLYTARPTRPKLSGGMSRSCVCLCHQRVRMCVIAARQARWHTRVQKKSKDVRATRLPLLPHISRGQARTGLVTTPHDYAHTPALRAATS